MARGSAAWRGKWLVAAWRSFCPMRGNLPGDGIFKFQIRAESGIFVSMPLSRKKDIPSNARNANCPRLGAGRPAQPARLDVAGRRPRDDRIDRRGVRLAFLFRTFEAEAFVIPTGSMAPTLMGRHKDMNCPECGNEYQISASEKQDPLTRQDTSRQGR